MPRAPKPSRKSSARLNGRSPRRWKFGWERLEDYTLLSAYLYIDYGDNFAGGVLQGADINAGALFSHTVDGTNINGPKLTDSDGNNFADATSVMLTSFANFYAGTGQSVAEIQQMRQTATAMVQRVYGPYDVTVIDLTAAGTTVNGKTVAAAANFDDVARTLAASGNGHDSYVFVAQAIIGGATASNTTDPTQFAENGYGGKASGLDIGETNTHTGTALSLLRSDYGVNKVGQTISHEAGHLFGMAHVWRGDKGDDPDPRDSLGAYKDQLDLYHAFETMSYLAFSGDSAFSRMPMVADKVLDGGNWVPNLDTSILNAAPNPYEHFKADPGVGVSNVEYVTGTGAHDIITIVKTGATTAQVSIQPFFDTTYTTAINIPGQATATYTYSIDTTKPIIIDGGSGSDRFVIDGDLGTTITVRGDTWSNDAGGKLDSLIVLGKGAANGVYTPGTNKADSLAGGSDFRGTITIDATIINFMEFTSTSIVTVSNVQNFIYRTPAAPVGGFGGNRLVIDSPAAGQNRIGRNGTTSGVGVIPLTFFDIVDFTIDTATNNASLPNDTITLNQPGLIASALKNFTINTGDGDDVFIANANFSLPVPGGAFTYNAGAHATPGGDNLIVNAPGASTGVFRPNGATAGTGLFIEDGTTLNTTGLERAEVDGFTDFSLITPNDADVMTITRDLLGTGSFGENKIAGTSGEVAFSTLSFYQVTNFLIDSRTNNPGGLRGNSYTIDNPLGRALQAEGLKNFTIRSGAGNDVLTVNANDFRLPVAGGEFLFDSGSGHYPGDVPASNRRGLISLDRIVVNADVDFFLTESGDVGPDQTPPEGWLSFASAGSGQAPSALLGGIRLIGVEDATLTGGPSGNRMDGLNFSGRLVLNGGDGDDTLIGGWGDNELNGGDGDNVLIAGSDRFSAPGMSSLHHALLGDGGTNILRGGAGRNTFHADLNGTAILIGGDGENLFIITNTTGTVWAPVGGITIVGGGTAGDTLRLVGGGGPTYNQTYLVGPGVGEGQIVTTNNYNPDGPTISQFIRFTGLAAIEDAITANTFTVVGASAAAPIAGATSADLAAGQLHLTVGGSPFAAITFQNKTTPSVTLGDGQVVTLPPPIVWIPYLVTPFAPTLLAVENATPAPESLLAPAPLAAVETPIAPAASIATNQPPLAPGRPNFSRMAGRRSNIATRPAARTRLNHPTTTPHVAARRLANQPVSHKTTVKPTRSVVHRGPLALSWRA